MASNSNSSSSNNNKNPLDDPDVRSMLDDVEDGGTIQSEHDFGKWQKSFLEKFTAFLDSDSADQARASYATFSKSSDSLIKIVRQLQRHIDQGNLSVDKTTVKARTGLGQLKATLTKLVEELATLLPTTASEIRRFGFTKYHMGAVLVDDGFKQYAVMRYCRALLKLLRVAALDQVADRQILDECDRFGKKFDVFCGVMESLNMMKVCRVASQFLHAELIEEADKFEALADGMKAASASARSGGLKSGKGSAAAGEMPKARDVTSVANREAGKDDSSYETVGYEEQDEDDDASSYETIESIHTVSSYEDVVQDDDSSYETVEVISEPSEYTTEEEEVVVSDYVTDSSLERERAERAAARKKKIEERDARRAARAAKKAEAKQAAKVKAREEKGKLHSEEVSRSGIVHGSGQSGGLARCKNRPLITTFDPPCD